MIKIKYRSMSAALIVAPAGCGSSDAPTHAPADFTGGAGVWGANPTGLRTSALPMRFAMRPSTSALDIAIAPRVNTVQNEKFDPGTTVWRPPV